MSRPYYIPGTNIPNPTVDPLAYTYYLNNTSIMPRSRPYGGGSSAISKQAGIADYYNALAKQKLAQAEETKARAENYTDYNDPREVNSIADILLNWGRWQQDPNAMLKESAEHLVNSVWGNLTGLKYKNKSWVKEDPDKYAALSNFLGELSEDLDVSVNAVKSLAAPLVDKDTRTELWDTVIDTLVLSPTYKPKEGPSKNIGLSGMENLKATVGLGEDKGARKNFDYDTGNGVVNFALELVSDPLDWVSWGASGVVKKGVKEGMLSFNAEAATHLLKNYDGAVVDSVLQGVERTINKRITRSVLDNTSDALRVLDDLQIKNGFKLFKNPDEIVAQATEDFIKFTKTNLTENMITNTMKNASKLYRGSEKIQRNLLKIGTSTSPILPVAKLVKLGLDGRLATDLRLQRDVNQLVNKENKEIEFIYNTIPEDNLVRLMQLEKQPTPLSVIGKLLKEKDTPKSIHPVLTAQQDETIKEIKSFLNVITHSRYTDDMATYLKLKNDFAQVHGYKNLNEMADDIHYTFSEQDSLVRALRDEAKRTTAQPVKPFEYKTTSNVPTTAEEDAEEIKNNTEIILDQLLDWTLLADDFISHLKSINKFNTDGVETSKIHRLLDPLTEELKSREVADNLVNQIITAVKSMDVDALDASLDVLRQTVDTKVIDVTKPVIEAPIKYVPKPSSLDLVSKYFTNGRWSVEQLGASKETVDALQQEAVDYVSFIKEHDMKLPKYFEDALTTAASTDEPTKLAQACNTLLKGTVKYKDENGIELVDNALEHFSNTYHTTWDVSSVARNTLIDDAQQTKATYLKELEKTLTDLEAQGNFIDFKEQGQLKVLSERVQTLSKKQTAEEIVSYLEQLGYYESVLKQPQGAFTEAVSFNKTNLVKHLEEIANNVQFTKPKFMSTTLTKEQFDNAKLYLVKQSNLESEFMLLDAVDLKNNYSALKQSLEFLSAEANDTDRILIQSADEYTEQLMAFETMLSRIGQRNDPNEYARKAMDLLCNYWKRSVKDFAGVNRFAYYDQLIHDFESYLGIPKGAAKTDPLVLNALSAVEEYVTRLYTINPELPFAPHFAKIKTTFKEVASIYSTTIDGFPKEIQEFFKFAGISKDIGTAYQEFSVTNNVRYKNKYVITAKDQVLVNNKWVNLPEKIEGQHLKGMFPYIETATKGLVSFETELTGAVLKDMGAIRLKPEDTITWDAVYHLKNKLNKMTDYKYSPVVYDSIIKEDAEWFKDYKQMNEAIYNFLEDNGIETVYRYLDVSSDSWSDLALYYISHDLNRVLYSVYKNGKITDSTYDIFMETLEEQTSRAHVDFMINSKYIRGEQFYVPARKTWDVYNTEPPKECLREERTLKEYADNMKRLYSFKEVPEDVLTFISNHEGPNGPTQSLIVDVYDGIRKDSGFEVSQARYADIRKDKTATEYKKYIYEESNKDVLLRTQEILHRTPEELKAFIQDETPGFIALTPNSAEMLKLINNLENNTEAFAELGMYLKHYKDVEGRTIYLVGVDASKDIYRFNADAVATKIKAGEHQPIRWLARNGVKGSILSTHFLEEQHVRAFIASLPEDIRQLVPNMDDLKTGQFFDYLRFDNTFLGDANFMRTIDEYMPTDISKRMSIMMNKYVKHQTLKELSTLAFESEGLRVKYNNAFNKVPVGEVAQAFKKHTELVGLYYIGKGTKRVARIMEMDSENILRKYARRVNPIIMNRSEANKIVSVYNAKGYVYPLPLSVLDTTVNVLKAGYLSSIGFVQRNIVSSVTKSLLSSDIAPSEIFERVAFTHKSILELQRYKECYLELQRFSKDLAITQGKDGVPELSRKIIEDFFVEQAEWAKFKDTFLEIFKWQKSGPTSFTAAEAEALENNGAIMGVKLLESRKNSTARLFKSNPDLYYIDPETGLPAGVATGMEGTYRKLKIEQAVKDYAWKNAWTRRIVDVNNEVEVALRYDTYRWERTTHGANFNEAAQKVTDIHFDYSNASTTMRFMDMVLPFINFRVNNAKYWMLKTLQDPTIARAYMAVLKGNGSLSEDIEVKLNEPYYMAALFSGAVPITEHYNMKMGFDFLDALNTAFNPIDEIKESLIVFKSWSKWKEYEEAEALATQKYSDQVSVPMLPLKTATSAQFYYEQQMEYYKNQKTLLAINAAPFLGVMLTRMNKLAENTEFKWNGDELEAASSTMVHDLSTSLPENILGLIPSVFGKHNPKFYYSFGNSNYVTKDYEKYLAAINKDAVEGWAGISQPIQEPKKYYAFTFPYGDQKYMYTAKPDTAVRMLLKGAVPLNEEMETLHSEVDVQTKAYKRMTYSKPSTGKVHMPFDTQQQWGSVKQTYPSYDKSYKFKAKYKSTWSNKLVNRNPFYYSTSRAMKKVYNQRKYRTVYTRTMH